MIATSTTQSPRARKGKKMRAATHKRNLNSIQDLGSKEVKHYASINKAKKASHDLQMKSDGALGRGSMVAM